MKGTFHMLRRALATAAVSAIAVVGLAPAANAQIIDLTPVINAIPCTQLGQGLEALDLVDEDTTRNQLAWCSSSASIKWTT